MSKDYDIFEGEPGESAFMAGIVEILANWLQPLCACHDAFEADIFFVKENDLSLLDGEIKRRLLKIRKTLQPVYTSEQEIERLKFKLKPVDVDVRQYVCDAFSRFASNNPWSKGVSAEDVSSNARLFLCADAVPPASVSDEDISRNVRGFFAELDYYLREPLRVYEGDTASKNEVLKILGEMYMSFAFEYFFVAYDEWMLLFLFGTFE